MIVRGPKEILIELLALDGEIERVEDLRRRWNLGEDVKEELLNSIVRQKVSEQE